MGLAPADRIGGFELTAAQEAAITALLSSRTVRDAARKCKVTAATIYNWLKEDYFRREYRRHRQAMLDASLSALCTLSADAVATLKRNLKCGAPASEVKAAVAILDKAIDGQALADMQAEIEELRDQLRRGNEAGNGGTGPGTGGTPGGGDSPVLSVNVGGVAVPGPAGPVPVGGVDAGPVAGAVPPEPEPPADAPGLPTGRKDDGGGGPDPTPLFE